MDARQYEIASRHYGVTTVQYERLRQSLTTDGLYDEWEALLSILALYEKDRRNAVTVEQCNRKKH